MCVCVCVCVCVKAAYDVTTSLSLANQVFEFSMPNWTCNFKSVLIIKNEPTVTEYPLISAVIQLFLILWSKRWYNPQSVEGLRVQQEQYKLKYICSRNHGNKYINESNKMKVRDSFAVWTATHIIIICYSFYFYWVINREITHTGDYTAFVYTVHCICG